MRKPILIKSSPIIMCCSDNPKKPKRPSRAEYFRTRREQNKVKSRAGIKKPCYRYTQMYNLNFCNYRSLLGVAWETNFYLYPGIFGNPSFPASIRHIPRSLPKTLPGIKLPHNPVSYTDRMLAAILKTEGFMKSCRALHPYWWDIFYARPLYARHSFYNAIIYRYNYDRSPSPSTLDNHIRPLSREEEMYL